MKTKQQMFKRIETLEETIEQLNLQINQLKMHNNTLKMYLGILLKRYPSSQTIISNNEISEYRSTDNIQSTHSHNKSLILLNLETNKQEDRNAKNSNFIN